MALANRKIGYDEVVTRDIHFPMNIENVARHWFRNDPWSTHWMNAILAAVPDGERWVMNSARRQLGKLDDPEVLNAAKEFIRQERIHAREHDEMNAIGVQHGVPIDKVEGVFKLIRKQLQHRLSDDMQSSIATAFEHFTAIISAVLLEHPELFDETHPDLRAMLYWHFVEETEHKSVSYDVFVDASGGGYRSYRLRLSGMLLAIALGFPHYDRQPDLSALQRSSNSEFALSRQNDQGAVLASRHSLQGSDWRAPLFLSHFPPLG